MYDYSVSTKQCSMFICVSVQRSFVFRSLGEQISTIELGTSRLSDVQLESVDRIANERIREALPVKTLM